MVNRFEQHPHIIVVAPDLYRNDPLPAGWNESLRREGFKVHLNIFKRYRLSVRNHSEPFQSRSRQDDRISLLSSEFSQTSRHVPPKIDDLQIGSFQTQLMLTSNAAR